MFLDHWLEANATIIASRTGSACAPRAGRIFYALSAADRGEGAGRLSVAPADCRRPGARRGSARAQPVVGNHSTYRALDQQLGVTGPSGLYRFGLMAADVTGETHVRFVFFFAAAYTHLFGVDDDNEVAGVYVRSENWFLLAPEQVSGLHRHSAQDL